MRSRTLPRADIGTSLEILLKKGWNREKSSLIIVVAEGDESGGGKKLQELVKKHRPSHSVGVCILGHTQRGGSPTATDRILASEFGYAAIENLLQGKKNCMVAKQKNEICLVPLEKIKRHHLELNTHLLKLITTLAT